MEVASCSSRCSFAVPSKKSAYGTRKSSNRVRQAEPRRSLLVTSSVNYQQDPTTIPPPPPPPPPPPQPTRRGFLQYAGLAGAAAAGLLGGYLLGSNSTAAPGVTAAEKRDVDELREELHFRRNYDGRVQVQDVGTGEWWDVRTDARLPGTVLLRDPRSDVFFITYDNLQQIDLTDDYIVGTLFAGGDWKASMTRLQARSEGGQLVDVYLTRDAFYEQVSLLNPV